MKKEPPRAYPTWTAPASFTLHEGNFSSDGVILDHHAQPLGRQPSIFEVAEGSQADPGASGLWRQHGTTAPG